MRKIIVPLIITSFIVAAAGLPAARAGVLPIADLGSLLFPPGQSNIQPYGIVLNPETRTVSATPEVYPGATEYFTYDAAGRGLKRIQETLFTINVDEATSSPSAVFTQYLHTGQTFIPFAINTTIPGTIEGDVLVDGVQFHILIDMNSAPWMVLASTPGFTYAPMPVYPQSGYAAIVAANLLYAIEPNAPTPGSFLVHKWYQYVDGWTDGAYRAPAAPSNVSHLVLSEVQVRGASSTDDFIELYNPTDQTIDLDGYRLVKRTASGGTDTTIKSWTAQTPIQAHGFYLWANSGYTSIPTLPDTTTTQSIADNNSIALRFGPENTGALIDSVAWGTAQNGLGEGANLPSNLPANQSYERRVWQGIACFSPQGVAEELGNGCDRGDSSTDFEVRAVPNPQHSWGTTEP